MLKPNATLSKPLHALEIYKTRTAALQDFLCCILADAPLNPHTGARREINGIETRNKLLQTFDQFL
jgi:hypothetical protein